MTGAPIIEHRTPSPRATVLYWLARIFLKQVYRVWPLGDRGIRALRIIESAFAQLPKPRRVRHSHTVLGGVPAGTCSPPQPAGDALAGAHVLFLHGGAFIFCGTATHLRLCSSLAETLGVPVHSLRYRQLPEAGVGTSVHDAYAAYRALTRIAAPGKVIVAGDSAGGFLAAKICELADRDGIEPPAAFVGYSPQLSLDADQRDPTLLKHDAYQPLSAVRRAKTKWLRGDIELFGLRTPIDAPVAAFPPAFFTVAERELLEHDILAFTRRLSDAGTPVQTHRWRRGVHAFPVLAGLLPEGREAVRLTGQFLRAMLGPPEVCDRRVGACGP
ncbi:alpha/beta hydrolase [[Mycobacterium] nativiensis]|uniref:Alpha/beta hydrolase n=1 Tax=[Mycobacterium] nativiensis TaxID=2855503 RepID=A0ABU5XTS6_9MYCO|nr:alpha/beta hydrolase [Mycolicibacter sp. MYC340]MEB3031379.1 alpha/beta hydrolase [Mycolicibacter sp. MYC340]